MKRADSTLIFTFGCLNFVLTARNYQHCLTTSCLVLVDVGVSKKARVGRDQFYYRKYLEDPLIAEAKQYYKIESLEFLQQNSISEYLKKVYSLLLQFGVKCIRRCVVTVDG